MSPQETLFRDFLASWHDGSSSGIDELCDSHPEHASDFRRWWQRLIEMGEVDEQAEAGAAELGTIAHYRILREIGHGSQGTVYLAEDQKLKRRVALKILPSRGTSQQALARFEREAAIAAQLDHPGVCTIYETGTEGATRFIAMRWIDGESLATRIARMRREKTPVDIGSTIATFEQMARALHAAHERGLIHRDVKPGNLMVLPNGKPVVLDFGLARTVSEEEDHTVTRTGDLVGTPAYMSPEQVAAQRIELDRRTDVYSLGATLYEALTLQRPYEAPTRSSLYQQIVMADPADPRRTNPRISRDLAVVIETALEKNRDARYQTAADFAEDLRRLREHEPIRARPLGPLARFGRWVRRRPATAASTLTVLVALIGGLVVSTAFWREAQTARSRYDRLADVVKLRDARQDAEDLRPAPEMVDRLERWLRDQAQPLVDRLPKHRATLDELRVRALPRSREELEGDRARHPERPKLGELQRQREQYLVRAREAKSAAIRARWNRAAEHMNAPIRDLEQRVGQRWRWDFAAGEYRFLHEALTELVRELEQFTGPRGLVAQVTQRLEWARTVRERSIERYAARWAEVRSALADNAWYGKRKLVPQVGLVPIGRDPKSRLYEFSHLRSGAAAERDATSGALTIRAETGIVFVLVPAGRFRMGAQGELGRSDLTQAVRTHESPAHGVELDWFFISKHEITQAQWARLANGARPSALMTDVDPETADLHPVTQVSWDDCVMVAQRFGMTLPTEAQWEYAARAATRTVWPYGDHADDLEGCANLRDRSVPKTVKRLVGFSDGYVKTAPICAFEPNPFGLHDMVGNVSEWCLESWWETRGYEQVEHRVGDGWMVFPDKGQRVTRGGSFNSYPGRCRPAARRPVVRTQRREVVGFRAVRTVQQARR